VFSSTVLPKPSLLSIYPQKKQKNKQTVSETLVLLQLAEVTTLINSSSRTSWAELPLATVAAAER